MIIEQQETNVQTVPARQGTTNYLMVTEAIVSNETSDGFLSANLFSVLLNYNILSSGWELAYGLGHTNHGMQSRGLLSILEITLAALQRSGADLSHVPQLQSYLVEDGSVLMEWTLPNFRIGFSIEADPSQSSWFLVTTKELGSLAGSGYLAVQHLTRLISALIDFLVSHC